MLFADRVTFDHPRKTADGYLVVRARAARAGIYDYLGKEIDPKGERFAADDVVKVYRPEEEVFNQDSVASFLMKPVTNDHPSKPVTADNWRDYAKGVVGKALRDGDFLAFDIVLMDKGIIADVEGGKRELSNGYSSEIDFTPGQTDTGEHFDAVQKTIRGNHVAVSALVDKAKAIVPNIVVDGKSDADIRKEVVTAKLGDDAKDFDDAKIEGAFAMLSKDQSAPQDPLRAAVQTGVRSVAKDGGAAVRNLVRASQF
jgi:hypothetical protein